MIKSDFSLSIRSVGITSDQETIVFGASRKILFKKLNDMINQKRKVREKKMEQLGNA
jgi:hypothetical protein